MRHSLRRFSSLLTFLMLAGIALSACTVPGFNTSTGSGSSSGSDDMTLKIGQISTSVAYFPEYVAAQKGFFTKLGLKVAAPTILGTGAKVAAAVEANSVEIGDGFTTDVFNLTRQDSSARLVGSLANGYYIDVTGSNAFIASSGLNAQSTLQDKVLALKGKKIGVTGPASGTSGLMTYLFKQYGMDASKDATLVPLGSTSTAALAALQSGKVDALSFFSPIGLTAEAKKYGTILISPDAGDIPGLTGDVEGAIYTKQSVIDAKPKSVAAYLKGIAEAEAFIQSNQSDAQAMLATYLKVPAATAQKVFASMVSIWAKDPTISEKSYNVAADFNVKAGLISAAPKYTNVVAESTIESAIK